MAGFSCQPYSSGGQQRGVHDQRSETLPAILRAAMMLRSPLIMLECVKGAGSNRFVRNLLDTFVAEFQFALGEAAPCFGLIPIPAMPVLASQDFFHYHKMAFQLSIFKCYSMLVSGSVVNITLDGRDPEPVDM